MPIEGLQLGHYRLLHLIGSGGMGEVYLAEDLGIQRQVAIKVVRSEVTPYPNASTKHDAARLFQREARAVAMLDHPHILSLYDYGQQTIKGIEYTYLVMPFRSEGSLVTWLQERSSSTMLSLEDIVYIVRQASGSLQYAHDRQIIHQDVKPSNFLIRHNPDNPRHPDLLLTDFGIAKLGTATSSASQSIRGTPAYMAPEQWEGNPFTATDQYALAVMVYELLTGQLPFQGPPMRMMYLHANVVPQAPSKLNPQLPDDIDTVLLQALSKKPQERFVRISAFATAVQQALHSTDSSTIIRTALPPASNEIRVTLAISEVEARTGTQRTLTLPDGRQVSVSVPAIAWDGQIIRLQNVVEPASSSGPAGTLIITLRVQAVDETARPSNPGSPDLTIPASHPNVRAYLSPYYLSPREGSPAFPLETIKAESTVKGQERAKGRNILVAVLSVLIVVSSLGMALYIVTNKITTDQNNATATTQAQLAQFNDATATANASNTATIASTAQVNNATATAQANAAATAQAGAAATAQASATAQAQAQAGATAAAATATAANPDPYPPHNGVIALNDPLRDNSQGNHWKEYADNLSACTFTGGTYHVRENKNKYFADCFSTPDFGNLTYQVEMQIIQGDCGGFIFRADATLNQFYFFRICVDGSYSLILYVDNTNANAQTLASNVNSAINMGLDQTNVIAVVASGTQINLYVNQQEIDSVVDSSYSSGQIGVCAQAISNSTEVVFSNAKVWTL